MILAKFGEKAKICVLNEQNMNICNAIAIYDCRKLHLTVSLQPDLKKVDTMSGDFLSQCQSDINY